MPKQTPPKDWASLPSSDSPELDRRATSGRRWYGSQILILDSIALGLLLMSGAAQSEEALGLSVVTYFVGPPIVHAAHGRGGMSFASFGVRLGGPLLGGLAAADDGGNDSKILLGLSLGVIGAIALDSAVFAWESTEKPTPKPSDAHRLRVAPAVAALPGGASAGVVGTF